MHIIYGKYLEKVKNEIDRLVVEEAEGQLLNHENEETLEMLLGNYEGVKCLLHDEMAGKHEPAMMATAANPK